MALIKNKQAFVGKTNNTIKEREKERNPKRAFDYQLQRPERERERGQKRALCVHRSCMVAILEKNLFKRNRAGSKIEKWRNSHRQKENNIANVSADYSC